MNIGSHQVQKSLYSLLLQTSDSLNLFIHLHDISRALGAIVENDIDVLFMAKHSIDMFFCTWISAEFLHEPPSTAQRNASDEV